MDKGNKNITWDRIISSLMLPSLQSTLEPSSRSRHQCVQPNTYSKPHNRNRYRRPGCQSNTLHVKGEKHQIPQLIHQHKLPPHWITSISSLDNNSPTPASVLLPPLLTLHCFTLLCIALHLHRIVFLCIGLRCFALPWVGLLGCECCRM